MKQHIIKSWLILLRNKNKPLLIFLKTCIKASLFFDNKKDPSCNKSLFGSPLSLSPINDYFATIIGKHYYPKKARKNQIYSKKQRLWQLGVHPTFTRCFFYKNSISVDFKLCLWYYTCATQFNICHSGIRLLPITQILPPTLVKLCRDNGRFVLYRAVPSTSWRALFYGK